MASAIIARARGASTSYLIDAGRYAVEDLANYQQLIEALNANGEVVTELPDSSSFDAMLEQYGGVYLTDGLDSLREVPDHSVDFAWSNAVLEHVRRAEFEDVQKELLTCAETGWGHIPPHRSERSSWRGTGQSAGVE